MILTHNQLLNVGALFHGKAWISGVGEGIVTINGIPASRQVVALEQSSLTVVAQTWSFPDGTYLLPNLDKSKLYIVMAYDYKGDYAPVAESHIAPHLPLAIGLDFRQPENETT